MTKFTIEIDYDMTDKITFDNLKDCRQRFLDDLGQNNSVFVWDDPEEDDAEIQRHIDALDVVLKWYGTPEQVKELYGE
jgi:hypothetical protein